MAVFIVIGVAAVWGVLSVLCLLLGWLLPGDRRAHMLYLCEPDTCAEYVIFGYQWMRELGIVAGSLLLVDSTATPKEMEILKRKHKGVEFCSLEDLKTRLELERDQIG